MKKATLIASIIILTIAGLGVYFSQIKPKISSDEAAAIAGNWLTSQGGTVSHFTLHQPQLEIDYGGIFPRYVWMVRFERFESNIAGIRIDIYVDAVSGAIVRTAGGIS
jgi:hypothetical protein